MTLITAVGQILKMMLKGFVHNVFIPLQEVLNPFILGRQLLMADYHMYMYLACISFHPYMQARSLMPLTCVVKRIQRITQNQAILYFFTSSSFLYKFEFIFYYLQRFTTRVLHFKVHLFNRHSVVVGRWSEGQQCGRCNK